MSEALLDRLQADHAALIAALDADDIERIEGATEALTASVEQLRAQAAWQTTPEIEAQARQIWSMSEAARVRVNLLTDLNQQRIEVLASLKGRTGSGNYGRDGRKTA